MKPKSSPQSSVGGLIAIACALWIPQFTLEIQAQVLDQGFESAAPGNYTGSLGDGWITTQGTIKVIGSGQLGGAVAHTGNQFADLDFSFTLNTVAQTIPTVPNQAYTLSYWIADTSPDPLTVLFDGAVLFNGSAPAAGVTSPDSYVQHVFTVTPSSSSALLSFTGHYTSSGGTLGTILDDVSLTPVPEPSSLALMAIGVLAAFVTLMFPRSQIAKRKHGFRFSLFFVTFCDFLWRFQIRYTRSPKTR